MLKAEELTNNTRANLLILASCFFFMTATAQITDTTGRCGLHFFMFVALLHKEERLVSLEILLVSERMLKRMQRSTYQEVQRRLFELWEAFNKKKSLKFCD